MRVNLCECVNGCLLSISILNRVSFRVLVLYTGIGSGGGGIDHGFMGELAHYRCDNVCVLKGRERRTAVACK